MQEAILQKYIDQLTSMNVSNRDGYKAPHKAILMLSVIDSVQAGHINSSEIRYDAQLENIFNENWSRYIQIQTRFICNIWMPLKYIGSEPFVISATHDSFRIDLDLFRLLQDPESTDTIVGAIVEKYLAVFAN